MKDLLGGAGDLDSYIKGGSRCISSSVRENREATPEDVESNKNHEAKQKDVERKTQRVEQKDHGDLDALFDEIEDWLEEGSNSANNEETSSANAKKKKKSGSALKRARREKEQEAAAERPPGEKEPPMEELDGADECGKWEEIDDSLEDEGDAPRGAPSNSYPHGECVD
jgi:hypothetical protein